MMVINVISLFPQMIVDSMQYGVIGRAIKHNLIELNVFNPRDFAGNKHNNIDDKPFGGGSGMVMMYDPLFRTLEHIKTNYVFGSLLYLSPQGESLKQLAVNKLALKQTLTLLCGRYEGVDQRFIDKHVDHEISIGDYVISGGELAACVVIDAVCRQIKGVLGAEESAKNDSFMNNMLAHHQYTRSNILGQSGVPDVLLSGNHKEIEKWREDEALALTRRKRPDLMAGTSED
ncbi:MAG: tRNA (guanosine(37)-N1)-methyltransferase TrmD [Proteobacteria bacterium]|nr:tRNA (guanosine(37)-N1)-methyltransferase TrmD [Pseudomonadota bacterium]